MANVKIETGEIICIKTINSTHKPNTIHVRLFLIYITIYFQIK